MPTPDALITFLPVRDLDATHRFYHEVLELPLVIEQSGCRVYRTVGSAYLGFCRREEVNVAKHVIATFVTDDVDGWHRRLVEHGVETDGPPRHNPTYALYHFFARDPDGWAVEVQRFDDPEWAGAG
jgi:catechol 2,3-dioxygenase-like lactoylglutathione lyase family enzyme